MADRLRHAEQHERERGYRQPRERDRRGKAAASQRRREHEPKQQRHLSDSDAHRGSGDPGKKSDPVGEEADGRACPTGKQKRGCDQGRQDPSAGRGADPLQPGDLRMAEQPGKGHRHAAGRSAAAAGAGAGGNGGRHRAERAEGLRYAGSEKNRRVDGDPLCDRREQVSRPDITGRNGLRARGAQGAGLRPDEMRQRHPLAGQRTPAGSGRNIHTGE